MDLITPGTKTAQERVFIQPPGLVRGVELAKRSLAHLARYFSENQLTMIDELVEREIENATLESAKKEKCQTKERQSPMEILQAVREPLRVFGELPPLRKSYWG